MKKKLLEGFYYNEIPYMDIEYYKSFYNNYNEANKNCIEILNKSLLSIKYCNNYKYVKPDCEKICKNNSNIKFEKLYNLNKFYTIYYNNDDGICVESIKCEKNEIIPKKEKDKESLLQYLIDTHIRGLQFKKPSYRCINYKFNYDEIFTEYNKIRQNYKYINIKQTYNIIREKYNISELQYRKILKTFNIDGKLLKECNRIKIYNYYLSLKKNKTKDVNIIPQILNKFNISIRTFKRIKKELN